jgi:tRNA A-37 threonylcarbamoyl transferase component Bud32
MIWWEIDESFRDKLDEIGIGNFKALMDEPVGELIDIEEGSRQIRRIRLSSGSQPSHLFLKRIGRERLGRLLRMLAFGRKPRSGPLREKMLIDALSKAGLPVMRPLAWGEERRFCLPVRGFLLVQEVQGSDMAELFASSTSDERLSLVEALGRFVGRLHCKGFYQPVRLKDVFCESPVNADSFILIDREANKPWVSMFSRRRCVNSLARAYRRTVRDGHRLSREEIDGFMRNYLIEMNGKHYISKRMFRKIIC